jgi:hypothetical protein
MNEIATKIGLACCIFFLHCYFLSAQTSFGVKGGASTMQVGFTPTLVGTRKLLIGHESGLVFQHISEPHLGIQLAATFSQVAWQQKFDTVNFFRQDFYKVTLPFTTFIYLGKSPNSVFFNIGPVMSYVLALRNKSQLYNEDYNYHLEDYACTRLQLGLTASVGVAKKIGVGSVQLEARFTQNLTPLFKSRPKQTLQATSPRFLTVFLAYLLDWNSFF